MERHIVLVEPKIAANTGAIGRTCLGFESTLHLIRPFAFSLDEKKVRRAGLDYWKDVSLEIWNCFDDFINNMEVLKDELFLFSRFADKGIKEAVWKKRSFLVLGAETTGLPEDLVASYKDNLYKIETTGTIRSLNLATAAGIVLYESLRDSIME